MKNLTLIVIAALLLISCKQEISKTTYFKTKPNGKILNQSEFNNYKKDLFNKMKKIVDSTGTLEINYVLKDSIVSNDSIIKTYNPNIKMFFPDSEDDTNKGDEESEKIFSYLNKKLPSQVLYTDKNEKINLNELKGKPTLLNFWFTTCKPCIDEMPVLNDIKEKYLDKVNFISITFETKENVEKFMKKHKFDFTNIVGAKDYLNKLLGVEAFPKNVFIDKNGVVKRIESGIPYSSENKKLEIGNGKKFEKYIKELL